MSLETTNDLGGIMQNKFLAAILCIMLTAGTALAGSGTSTLFGAVHDNNTPLIGAEITVIGEATYTSRSTFTNEKGIYMIDKLPADEYIIRAIPQPEGIYKDGSANIFLGKNKEKEVNFPMKKK